MAINKRLIKSNDEGGGVAASFNTVLYTGDGNDNRQITVGFEPDFIWIKNRTSNWGHTLADRVRGLNAAGVYGALASDQTGAADTTNTFGAIKTLDLDGFTIKDGTDINGYYAVNRLNNDYVAWCWKAGGAAVSGTSSHYTNCVISANPDAGFSMVKFTIPGGTIPTTASYNHGLNAAPKLIITRPYNGYHGQSGWYTWAEPITTSNYLLLNTGDAATSAAVFSSVDSSTVKYRFASNNVGANSDVITYNFTDVDGYQKVGSYSGTGAVNHQVNVGFQPRFVMQKRTNSPGGSWNIIDNLRGDDNYLSANLSNTGGSMTASSFHLTSTGFTLDNSFGEWNASGGTYIYLAIA